MSWHHTKSYTVGGNLYQVTRHEEWNNDETQVEFYIEFTAKAGRVYVDCEEDLHKEGAFPTQLEVASALAEANKYTLTTREQLQVSAIAAERRLKAQQVTAK